MEEVKKITYVFGFGRKDKLDKKDYSDEFFYGYKHFRDSGYDVSLIEFETIENSKLIFFDKIIRKFLKLPSYTSNITSKKNLNIIKESEVIIFSTERTYLGSYLMYKKATKKEDTKKIAMFVMGLFSKLSNKPFLLNIQKKILLRILGRLDTIFFLGRGEMNAAEKIFPELKKKFYFLPFVVNKEFWEIQNVPELQERPNILFIGNDGNREYSKVIKIAEMMQSVNFTFITENIDKNEITSKNVNLISGHWNKSRLTDKDMIDYYDSAKLTIIPLRESLQPSGQSVALQSMSRGVPVMITYTEGFWDHQNYADHENILFIKDNSAENWVASIEKYFNDNISMKLLSKNSLKTFSELNDSNKFFETIKKRLEIN